MTNAYETLMNTTAGAKAILDSVIEGYGIADLVDCFFYDLNKQDQERFLAAAQEKMRVNS